MSSSIKNIWNSVLRQIQLTCTYIWTCYTITLTIARFHQFYKIKFLLCLLAKIVRYFCLGFRILWNTFVLFFKFKLDLRIPQWEALVLLGEECLKISTPCRLKKKKQKKGWKIFVSPYEKITWANSRCAINKIIWCLYSYVFQIRVNGRHIFMGYLNNTEKTEEMFDKDGWLCTGDFGILDSQSFIKITGRIKVRSIHWMKVYTRKFKMKSFWNRNPCKSKDWNSKSWEFRILCESRKYEKLFANFVRSRNWLLIFFPTQIVKLLFRFIHGLTRF